MASVHRHADSPYWYGRYPVADGRWVFRSTKLRDRKKALDLVQKYHDACRGTMTLLQAQKQISEIYSNLNEGQKLPAYTIKGYLDRWLKMRKAEISPSTWEAYVSTFDQFARYLGPGAGLDIKLLTRDDVAGFRQHRIETTSPATARQSIKQLNVALNEARREGVILANVGEGLTRIKRDPNAVETRPFTSEEIRKLHGVIRDPEWRGMFIFGLYTGQRLKDVAMAEWDKVNLKEGTIHLFVHKKRRWEKKFLARPLWEHLAEMKKTARGPALFPRAHSAVKRWGLSGPLSNQFKKYLVEAGILGKGEASHKSRGRGRGIRRIRLGVGFHSLRHGATSLLKQAGVPHAVAQEIVGHDSKQISQHYTHIGDEAIRASLDKIPNLLARGGAGKNRKK